MKRSRQDGRWKMMFLYKRKKMKERREGGKEETTKIKFRGSNR